MKRISHIILCMALTVVTVAQGRVGSDSIKSACPVVKIEVRQLPDLNIPRIGHSVFVVNGEPTVVGGHTTSFVPTATAEYYRDGQWHLMETAYPHDQGFSVPLSTGGVLIGGGHAEPLGIGYIHSVEMYDPATHTFKGFGCLDTKRCFASGTELDSGRVVISGNWYRDIDDIELFDGQKYFSIVKPSAQRRARPFVLRIAADDAIIFSGIDEHANLFDTIIVDRLKGEPFKVPLFNEWKPFAYLEDTDSRNYLVADGEQDTYTYLIPVKNKEGQVAICRIAGTRFSLLPTNGRIPTTCNGRHINYNNILNIDHKAGRAYLFGFGTGDGRLYVLAIDMAKSPAGLTLFYTEPTSHPIYGCPVLTPDGDLLLTGGMGCNPDSTVDNFTPHATVLLLPVGRHAYPTAGPEAQSHSWLWICFALVAVMAIVCYGYYRVRRSRKALAVHASPEPSKDAPASDLMQRICQLMDEQQLYRNSDLKLQDVADRLNSNRTYISNCIKAASGCSFSQFVNAYRVDYAMKQLKLYPDKKVSAIWTEAGFSTESSFFRAFKAANGITPNEWRAQQTVTE